MTGSHRNIFRALLAGVFAVAALAMIVSPTRYKVDLDTLGAIWGDVMRDLDSVVKTVRISTELEIEYGDEIAAWYWGDGGTEADRAYVAAVGARVAAEARRQDLPWTFHVVDASYPNAWAILGGHIYITTEMLDMIDSEAELAALLGHEIAHVDLMHCVDLVQNRLLLEHAGLDIAGYLLAIAEDMVRVGFSEVQENEADRYGMLLAAKAGYSPLNAIDTFRKFYLQHEYGPGEERPGGGPETEILGSLDQVLRDYFNTHPPFADRLDALRGMLETNAPGWEGETFRVGQAAYDERAFELGETPEDQTWTFSERAPDYLAARAELAFLLGRDAEAARFADALRETAPQDDRLERLTGLLAGESQPERPGTTPDPEPKPEPEAAREPTDQDTSETPKEIAQQGRDAFDDGRYQEAIDKLERAIAERPDYRWALNNLAWAYVTAGLPDFRNPERAIVLATRAIRIKEDADYLDTLGAANILLGEHVRAREAYDRAMAVDAEYAERLRQDLAFLGYQDDTDPGDALTAAIQDGHAPFTLAQSLERIRRLIPGRPDQARAEYEVQAALYPFHPGIAALARELGVTTPIARIAELSARGDHAAAVTLGRDLMSKRPPDSWAVKEPLSSALFALGRAEASGGALDQAHAHYTEAIDLREGDFAVALNNRALVNVKREETYHALQDIDGAIRLDPGNGLYHANRCFILRLRDQYDAALVSCERAFEAGLPENRENRAWVYLQRAMVGRVSGGIDGAVADFREALQLASPETIRQVQEAMTAAGLYSGPADGRVSETLLAATETCIRSDQCYAEGIERMGRTVDFLQ
ncbi:M48 family metalloprotease [Aestuariicoccus sp. MJ-SS9]|uniref:M48 family metalloprotease n=1 Tax=Aestuariicoccus sp. MJ-SS9 TaxID=3079855 RepID=UPI00290B6F32|nr:M48 family metalloprotease [Aestuariicoccus sp. MJ-SS9]MDU8913171.1 M48 family metalloprotease [Aestuariicoccus sp. MJ-SS9]